MLNRLTNALNFNAEALILRSERQRLIASNIANADTPNYVARDFNFSEALRQATGVKSQAQSSLAPVKLPVSATHGGHLNLQGQALGGKEKPELNYATAAQTNLDSNSVDMDRERANFADNTVRYEATLRFINSQVRTLNTAMTGQ